MPRSRSRSRKATSLPPLLLRLIQAASTSGQDAEGADISGAPDALRELGVLAMWALPIHGVFVANQPDLGVIIERVAKQHLGLDAARRELRESLKVVQPFERRDGIASAANRVQTVSDEVYFYAGLTFGISLAEYT